MPEPSSSAPSIVIFVHGIQGSWLKNEYPVDYDDSILWTGITKRKTSELQLHPRDAAVDRRVDVLAEPHQAVPLIYKDIVDEIRDELEAHPYVYSFSYDWRKDNRIAAQQLKQFTAKALRIAKVHERAAGRPAPKRVVYIGHSMGGLVIKWLTTQIWSTPKQRAHVDKVITIATPYAGSLKAVEALLPGARSLFGFEHRKSMRHSARTFPGVFQLLPSWKDALVRSDTKAALNVFLPKTWQRNLVAALEAEPFFPGYFKARLEDAKDFQSKSAAAWPKDMRDRVYCAAGLGSETWTQIEVDVADDCFFACDGAVADERGDGTVHERSSIRPELAADHLYIDEKHGVVDRVLGQHANMPNHSGVQDWVLGILALNEHAGRSFESPA